MEPLLISAPGDYTISQDMTQADPNRPAIRIVDDLHYVTIRLRSRLVGAGGPSSTNAAIEANGSSKVTIIGDGGSIRGFAYGVRLSNCYLATVRNVAIQDAFFRGIMINGAGAVISGCDVRNVTGALWTPNAYCMGVEVSGGQPSIIDNTVRNVTGVGGGEAVGISFTDRASDGVAKGNVLVNDDRPPKSFGVWVGGSSDVAVVHNHFSNWNVACAYSSPPTGLFDENTSVGCPTGFLDSGGDVVLGGMDG